MSKRDPWDEVMQLAEKYGFITAAYGGVAVLATYEEQQKAGIYEKTQRAAQRVIGKADSEAVSAGQGVL